MKLAVLLVLAFPAVSWAQSSPNPFSPKFFDTMKANEVQYRRQRVPDEAPRVSSDLEREQNESRASNLVVRAPAQSSMSGLTTVERVAAAVKTDLEDVEVGLKVVPFLAFGEPLSRLNVSLAALKEGVTQVGVAYDFTSHEEPLTIEELTGSDRKPLSCTYDLNALELGIEEIRSDYRDACAALIQLPDLSTPETERDYNEKAHYLRAACSGEQAIPQPSFSWGITQLSIFLDFYKPLVKTATAEDKRAQAKLILATNAESFKAIKSFSFGAFEKCPDTSEIENAVKRWRWERHEFRFGGGVQSQMFPLIWGFIPDCEGEQNTPECQTRRPELKEAQLQVEAAWAHQGLDMALGVGLAWGREARGEERYPAILPSLAIDWLMTPPGDDDLPQVTLGVEAVIRVSIKKPDVQEDQISKLEFTPHLDIVISDEISVRLGIPLSAKLEKRKADEENQVTEKRALQWTVPVFLATVLKLK